jgi:carbon starvation protein CstA
MYRYSPHYDLVPSFPTDCVSLLGDVTRIWLIIDCAHTLFLYSGQTLVGVALTMGCNIVTQDGRIEAVAKISVLPCVWKQEWQFQAVSSLQ